MPGPAVEEIRLDIAKKVREIVVKHCGKNKEGWDVTETPHFRVFHKKSNVTAEDVVRIAEKTRLTMSRTWLGHGGEQWRIGQ